MKTKDFIKMLQEEDPTGEGYVRLPGGGAPWFAEAKEGYWDGPYQYLELGEEKKFYPHDSVLVTSTKGYKIDIHVMDVDSIIWDANGDLEKIKQRIRYDLTYLNDDRIKSYWKYIEDEAAYARSSHEKSLAEWTTRTIDKYFSGGYEVRQPLNIKIGMYNHMTAYGFLGIKKDTFCQGECMAVIESGKFYYEEKKDYYVWHYDPEKGQNWSIR
jgi:hypothetical protein